MGRSGRKNANSGADLRVGRDLQGAEKKLGDIDSSGKVVGFIDQDGNCWESVLEHDLVSTQNRYKDEMKNWENAGGQKPNARLIASEVCVHEGNISEAARAAEERADEPFVDEEGEGWASVWDHDATTTVDAYIDAMEEWESDQRQGPEPDPRVFAENFCLDSNNVARAAEKAREEWSVIRQRRAVSGVPLGGEDSAGGYEEGVATYPGIIPGSQIEIVQEHPSGQQKAKLEESVNKFIEKLRAEGIEVAEKKQDEKSEFEQITEGVDVQEAGSWQGSFSYHVDALGHTVSVSTVRPEPRLAYEAGRGIEEAVMHGEISSSNVRPRVVLEGKSPEEQQEEALGRLAQGPRRKDLMIMEALGLDSEAVLRRDEAIASGRHVEQPLSLVEAEIFLPRLGQVRVLASGRSSKEALLHLQKVLPGASFEDSL